MGDHMDGRMFILKEEFAQMQIQKEELSEYSSLGIEQQNAIFMNLDYEGLLERIKKFYNAIESDGQSITLSHELLDKKSIIKISHNEIMIEKMETNMLLPLLKRLFRNAIIIEA